jgi:hypothetical protein
MSFQSTVSRLKENSDFARTGSDPIPWAFKGEHVFELRPVDEVRTRLIHREEFRSWMLPFLLKNLDISAGAGFHLMNEALKNEVERAYH